MSLFLLILNINLYANNIYTEQEFLGTSEYVPSEIDVPDMVQWRRDETELKTRQQASTLGESLHTIIRTFIPFWRELEDGRPLYPSYAFDEKKVDYSDAEVQEVIRDIGYEHNKEALMKGSFEELVNMRDRLDAARKDALYMKENYLHIKTYLTLLLVLLIVFLKKILQAIKAQMTAIKTKKLETKREKKEEKIRELVEEEAIKASVQKSIKNSDEEDMILLQEMINKAIAKGDTETAQALLKVLNSKKK